MFHSVYNTNSKTWYPIYMDVNNADILFTIHSQYLTDGWLAMFAGYNITFWLHVLKTVDDVAMYIDWTLQTIVHVRRMIKYKQVYVDVLKYCMRTLTGYFRINNMDQSITK